MLLGSVTPRSGRNSGMTGERMENDRLMTICTATIAHSVTRQDGSMPESVMPASSRIPVPIFAGMQDRCGRATCQSGGRAAYGNGRIIIPLKPSEITLDVMHLFV